MSKYAINYEKCTDRELLKLFSEKFREYDSLKDDELDFLDDHPNRDLWDKEQEDEYQELVGSIVDLSQELLKLTNHIDKL